MLRFLILSFAIIFPLLAVGGYAVFLLCTTAPISTLSIEKAGQYGDSFGVVACLFSGLAFSGVLITLFLQREEIKRSELEHAQNKRLTALAALLGVYSELADKKQAERDRYLSQPDLGDTGAIGEKLKDELEYILNKRNSIYRELERAAGLN